MSTTKENSEAVAPTVAVVGISALFPGSKDARGFWQDIMQGRDQIREVPPEYWLIEDYYDPDPAAPDKTYGKRGAFLDATPFDAMAFGVPPNVVQQTDTSQLLGLIVAQQVLEDAAGGDFAHIDKSRISVILGATGTTELVVHLGARLQRPIWLNALRQNGIAEDEAQAICNRIADSYVPWTEASFPGLLGNVIAGRIANKFDLGGTNCVVDAACASSLSALAMGLSELYMRQSDMVIVGGVDTLNDILMYMCFSKTPALSPSGDCRPFSDRADGTILGEGLGMLALRRLEDAERDGDRIYAVIRGVGSSSDGKGTAVYAPKASGQAHALRRAYAAAGYSPRTVELLEAHGTATKAGDIAEFEGASSVFAEADGETKQWCAIGSIKSQIGHTKGAAGAASLIKAVLALHHKVLPPTIKVERPNPNLAVEDSPFYINTQARPWVRDSSHPRRASVSSFGFGGSNFHVTLEEYTGSQGRKDRFRPAPTELFMLSADSTAALADAAGGLTAGLDGRDFQFLARETQRQFSIAAPLRLGVVAKDMPDLCAKLDAAITAIRRDPDAQQRSPSGWYYSGSAAPTSGKVAFLFPGQGSQYVGMGGDLAAAFAESQAVWDHAAELEFEQGGRLHEVVFPRPVFSDDARKVLEENLRATDWAQPAIGVTSLSQLAVLNRLGLHPAMTGGHSFGEVTALHAAGALDTKAFLHVARKRGELMAEAAAMFPGAMTAIAHPAAAVAELLAQWNTGVVIANHNTPDQVVISGIEAAVAACEERLRQAGIRHQRLPVATAFHSTVVRPATAPFHAYLNHVLVHPPAVPVYANGTAAVYSSVPKAVRETLADQIALPVLFVEQVEAMYAAGACIFVEVGPGTVLTNLVKSCLGERPHLAVAIDRKGEHGLTSLWHALALLAAAGVPLNLGSLWEGVAVGTDPRVRRTPKLAVPLSGVNYAKPYPPTNGAAGLAAPNLSRRDTTAATLIALTPPIAPVVLNGGATKQQKTSPSVNEPTNNPSSRLIEHAVAAAGNGHAASQLQPPAPTVKPLTAHVLPAAEPLPPAPTAELAPVQPAAPIMSEPVAPEPAAQRVAAVFPAPAVGASRQAQGPAAGVLANEEALAWAGVFQELQRQTADAHMAFLQVAEQSMKSLEAMLTLGVGSSVRAAPLPAAGLAPARISIPAPALPPAAPVPTAQSQPPTVQQASAAQQQIPAQQQMAAPRPLPAPVPVPVRPPAPVAPAPLPAPAAPVPAAASASAVQDLHGIMMEVVTEKTGYPTEMLEPGMALDTDLGIDSIKRVEILAAMRERVPALPEFDTSIMAGLRTLGEIVAYMDGQLGTAPVPVPVRAPAPVAPAPLPAPAAPVPAAASASAVQDLHGIMMEVVTEKTGYPTEMLEPGMALDTDLGIDSIKRVEILAAMRERVPALPEFDTSIMAGLRTLGEIVAYMDGQLAPRSSSAGAVPSAVSDPVPDPVPASATGSAAPAPSSIRRYTLQAVERPLPGLAPPFLIDGTTVFITDEGRGIAPALAAQLHAAGANAVVCTDVPPDAHAVICLAGLMAGGRADTADVNGAAFAAAAAVAKTYEGQGGLFVTVQDIGGDFGLATNPGERAWLGGLSGLAKTAAQEWPLAVVRSIDLACAHNGSGLAAEIAAERLANELLNGAADLEIGLPSDGRRLAFVSVDTPAAGGSSVVGEHSVLVVSGGGRGVTAAALLALAQAARPHVAVLGRTVLEQEPAAVAGIHDDAALKKALLAAAQAQGKRLSPKELGGAADRIQAVREIRSTLLALAAAGAQAMYVPCDVSDPLATAEALTTVRAQWGPITGIVHGAGVLADKRLAEKTPEDFRRVFGAKVQGLRSLLAAAQSDPLEVICLFSSVAGRTGNAGQADYAMANEVLNRVAQAEAKQRPGCVVKSIGWGPWAGGMVTPLLKAKFDELGVPLIPLAEGADAFVAELQAAARDEVEVVIGGMPQAAPLLETGVAPATRPFVFDVAVNAATYPYLGSHQVNGVVVLPLVLVQEWFLRAAAAAGIGGPGVSLQKMRVRRGMPLPDYGTRPVRLRVCCELAPDKPHTGKLALYDAEGAVRFVAEAATGRAQPASYPVANWPAAERPGHELYGHELFHGPYFAAVQTVRQIGETGAAAALLGSHALGWQGASWRLDPALIDGALQMARVWGYASLHKPTLPTACERLTVWQPGFAASGPLRCIVQGKPIGRAGTRCDLWLIDEVSRMTVAEIQGLEMYVSSEGPLGGREN